MSDKITLYFTRPFKFLSTWRDLPPYEMISYFFMFASVPILAYGIRPYDFEIIKIIIFTVATMYSGFFAALIWNDITDADIDNLVHPDRPLPSARISKKTFFKITLIFSGLTFFFSIIVSTWFFVIVIFAAIFVALHNKYLKRIARLPAYSEIFTSFQWTIIAFLGYMAIWSRFSFNNEIIINFPILGSFFTNGFEVTNMLILVFFIYFADSAHDLPEGIHDADGDGTYEIKTYATSFNEQISAKISLVMFFLAGMLGVLLFFRTELTLIFLIPFLLIWLYTIWFSYPLHKIGSSKEIKKFGSIVGRKRYNFLLFSFDFIFLDIFLQILF